MKTEIFTLCEYAAEHGGKLNIVGVFDSLFVKQEPAVLNHCTVALKLRYEKKDEGKHSVKIAINDAEGKTLLVLAEQTIEVQVPAQAPTASANLVVDMSQITIAKIGIYSVSLHVDGRELKAIPLYVYQVLPPSN